MANVAEVIIRAVDQATGPLKSIEGSANQLGASFTKMGTAMTVAGGAILGALGVVVKKAVDYGSELLEASQKTGIATEKLAGLKLAAEQSGASLDAIVSTMKFMSRATAEAQDGTATYVDAMRDLGIAVEDLKDLSQEELFSRIAGTMKGAATDTRKLAAATVVLGRGAQQLMPMFEEGAEGLAAFQREAERAGLALGSEAAGALEQFGDQMDKLKGPLAGIGLVIAQALLPSITTLSKWLLKAGEALSAFAKAHPTAFNAMTNLTAAAGALLATLGPLIIMLAHLKAALTALGMAGGAGKLAAGFTSAWTVISGAVTAIGSAVGLAAGWVVAAIAAIVAALFILGKWVHFAITEWDLFKLEVKYFGEELWALLTGPFVKLWEAVGYMANLGKNLILALWEGMKSVISSFWNWLDSALVGPLREVGAAMMGWSGGAVGSGMANMRLPGAAPAQGSTLNVYVDGRKAEQKRITDMSKVMISA